METNYSYLNLFIRSLIFSICSVLSIVVYSIFCVLLLPTSLTYRHKQIRRCLRYYLATLKYICHIDYRIEGLENIDLCTNGIIMCKHQSTWETFFLPIYFPNPAALAKRELSWIPFFGWALAASEPIFINRSDKKSAMHQLLAKGKQCLTAGRWVMIFPEGTRVPYGSSGVYKIGGARLASSTGYPIVPIAHNAGQFWPRRKFIKYPGTIHVIIGPPIPSQGRKAEDLLLTTKTWIEDHMEKITHGNS